MNVLTIAAGWRTYLAAAGLLGYALYQVSNADYPGAWTSLMAALAAFGLRQAVSGVQSELVATRLDVASHTAVVQQALDAARAKP